MDFFEMLSHRRSIRKFSDAQVSAEEIAKMVSAALDAPSSKNTRSSGFIVIENAETIGKIAGMRDYGSAFVENAPVVILVTGDTSKTDLWQVNASISATYLQLAAESLNLGNCWVHVDGRPHRQDEPNGTTAEEYLRGFLTIPQEKRVLCAIAIGHKADTITHIRKDYEDAGERVETIK